MDTLATLSARVTRLIGDQNPNGKWSTADLTEAIQEAVREAWPHFFYPVIDLTTFTGNNAIAATTTEIAVPSAFLPAAGVPPGIISGLEARPVYSSGISYGEWYDIEGGVQIDPLNATSPKIRFTNVEFWSMELRIYGARRLAIPSNQSDTIDGQDIDGYLEYLLWQTRFYLHGAREVGSEHDQYNHGRRGVLADERVKRIRRQKGRIFPHLTLMNK